MNQILFTRKTQELQPLLRLIEQQDHRTLIRWVIDCSLKAVQEFNQRYPMEHRLIEAHEATKFWAEGFIKMPQARRIALAAHQVAKGIPQDPIGVALAHSLGHVVGTVHVETHAMGFVAYYLTAYAWKVNHQKELIQNEIQWLIDRLTYWSKQPIDNQKWAPFLMKSTQPNKEWLLHEKELSKVKK